MSEYSALRNADGVASADYTAAITATSVLPTAFTITFAVNLVAITLIPAAAGVYIKFGGAATANTTLVPLPGLKLYVTKATADLMQIYAASSTRCSLIPEYPRN